MTDDKHLFAVLFTLTLASACEPEDDAVGSGSTAEDDSGSEGGQAGLEIAGSWIDNYMQMHVISDSSWATTSAGFSYSYTIDHFDNDAEFLVGQDDADMTWGKFEWTYDGGMVLWYCQTAFMQNTPEAAEAAPPADRTDPANGGCGGMFPWSRLDPAP